MRTRSAIGQLPVMTPSSTPASSDSVADRMNRMESMIQQLFLALPTTSSYPSASVPTTVSLSSSSTLAAPIVINSGDIDRKISPKKYRATQTSVTEGVDKCQINGKNSESHSMNFDDFQKLLNQVHLLALFNGSRKEPEATVSKKFGFSKDQVASINGETCLIPSDDIGLYHYDRSRPFHF